MSLSEKLKSVKTGLAVLVAGAMITGVAYAKEINNEGWPVPDDSQYSKLNEETKEFSCKYGDKEIILELKVESYANMDGNGYNKYIFEDKAFMYAKIGPGEGHSFKVEVLMDRDGNGSLETKYDLTKPADEKEFDKEGIPEWVIEKTIQSQKTKTN
jgi:hypothetical protein